jgi:hypothetical protein
MKFQSRKEQDSLSDLEFDTLLKFKKQGHCDERACVHCPLVNRCNDLQNKRQKVIDRVELVTLLYRKYLI